MGMGYGSAIHHVHFLPMGISTLPLQPAFQLCECLSESLPSAPAPCPGSVAHLLLLQRAVRGKVRSICRSQNWSLGQLVFSPRVCDPGREVDVVTHGKHSPVLLRGFPPSAPLSFIEFPFSFELG